MIEKTLKDKKLRWGILILVASIQAANYYFYDSFSPLKRYLEEYFQFTNVEFGLFVSAYSIPNVFLLMAIVGGIVLDKMGIRRTGFLFIGLMAFGGLLSAYGASELYTNNGPGYAIMSSFLTQFSPELKMMLVGRFFFGLGAETSIVVISKILVKWFKGKELATAFGIKIGLARFGSYAAFTFSGPIAESASSWYIAAWFAAMLLLIGLLAFVVYCIFDAKLDKQIESGSLLSAKDKFNFKDFLGLFTNRSFIFVTLLCLTFYSAVFPYQSFSADFFLNKHSFSISESGVVASLLSIGTIIFTPIWGIFVDKKGKSATLMMLGSVTIIIVYVILTFTKSLLMDYTMMFVLGIAFAMVPAAMWPSVAKIVPEKQIGSAFGTMFSIQNIGLMIVPILMGYLLDITNPGIKPEDVANGTASYDYTYAILLGAVLGLLGLLFAILLKREDKVSDYGLELPTNTKK